MSGITREQKLWSFLAEMARGEQAAMDAGDILNELAGTNKNQRIAYEEALSVLVKYDSQIHQDSLLRVYFNCNIFDRIK